MLEAKRGTAPASFPSLTQIDSERRLGPPDGALKESFRGSRRLFAPDRGERRARIAVDAIAADNTAVDLQSSANRALRRAIVLTSISGAVVGLPAIAESVRLFVSYIGGIKEQTIDTLLPPPSHFWGDAMPPLPNGSISLFESPRMQDLRDVLEPDDLARAGPANQVVVECIDSIVLHCVN